MASGRATEPVLRLLAEDALVRGDEAGTVRRYRELTDRYPQRVAYWTALAEAFHAASEAEAPEPGLWERVGERADGCLRAEERLWESLA